MKTILYATDFSDRSKNPLKFAWELKRKTGADLIFLHVFDVPTILDSPPRYTSFEDIDDDVEFFNRQKLIDLCESTIGIAALDEIKLFEARENKSASAGILEVIEESRADIVVMGTRGKSKLRELLMGSTAMDVVKNSSCPVMTVPPEAEYKPLERMVYATDFEQGDITALKFMAVIAEKFNAEISVVHITKTSEVESHDKMKTLENSVSENFRYRNFRFELLESEQIFNRLSEYVEANVADVVSLLDREKKRLIDRWFSPDILKKMEFQSSVPILSFNQRYLNRIGMSVREQVIEKQTP